MSLLANNVPVTKTGGASPTLQNSDLTDLLGVSVTSAVGIIAPSFTGNLSGLVLTAAQPNITSLGTLTNPVFTGTLTGASLNLDSGSLYYANGKVGIGTSSPTQPLDIKVGTNQHVIFVSAAGNPAIYGENDVTALTTFDIEGNPLMLNRYGGGNVGIGTNSPATTLDVNGNGTIRGNLNLGSTPTLSTLAGYLIIQPTGTLYLRSGSNGDIYIADGGGDVYTNAWADYSGTSTIVGWTSFTTKVIYTKKVGKTVFVNYLLAGTSNSTSTTFTVPYASASITGSFYGSATQVEDNTSVKTTPGMTVLPTSSQIVTIYLDSSGTTWTASGTKLVTGQFWYQSN